MSSLVIRHSSFAHGSSRYLSTMITMPHRLAATLALLAFAACLLAGGVHAGNPFSTTIQRALLAMASTYVIGLVIGLMAKKMIEENIKGVLKQQKKFPDSRTEAGTRDR